MSARLSWLFAAIFACFLSLGSVAAAQNAPHPMPRRPVPHRPATDAVGGPGNHPSAITAAPKEGASEAGVEHEHGPKDINWFDFTNSKQPPYAAMLINFALLIWIYVRFGKKPIQEGLKNRRDSIAKEIEEAQRMKKEAKARAKTYQAKLAGLGDELEATKQGLIDAGTADKERIVREAEEKAVRMKKDAAFMLDQEVRQMKVDLVKETVDVAIAAAEELLKKRVTQADQERLADEFLMQLSARGKKPPPPDGMPPPKAHSIPPFAATGGEP